jgi:hypothetical protein
LTGAVAWRTIVGSDNNFQTKESPMVQKYHLISAFT